MGAGPHSVSFRDANPELCARMRETLLAAVTPFRASTENIRLAVAERGWELTVSDIERVIELIGELVRRIDEQLGPGPAGDAAEDGEFFCRRVRHDLRNPISAMTGYLELAVEEARSRGDVAMAGALESLRNEALALLEIVDSVIRAS